MALAIVLVIYAVIAFIRGDGVFAFTPSVLMVLMAAVILGAFATVSQQQAASRAQVAALAVSVVLILASVAVPDAEVFVTETYWLLLWAAAAVLCALVLRRSATPAG